MLAPELIQPASSSKLGRVLIVEDEALIRDTIVLTLQDEGYDTVVAENGRMALELIQSMTAPSDRSIDQMFDLVILDVMLPFVNGLDLCRSIRHQGGTLPILMLSARDSETDRVVGLELGADDYLTKPFGMRELIARCRALLRRYRQPLPQSAQSVLTFHEITLSPQECRVTVRGDEVSLSPKEFRILELFMTHPRRVWSREQLIERVWGADFMGDSKTVDVHIRWLREKLEVDPSHPEHLLTVRGFGYRFV